VVSIYSIWPLICFMRSEPVNATHQRSMIAACLLFAGGAIVGAVGSVVFILRSSEFRQDENRGVAASRPGRRQLAVRIVLLVYLGMVGVALTVALAVGNVVFVATSGFLMFLVGAALVFLWSIDSP
jgi:hypothetical protein